jgi:DNA-binding NarL/FixJ family response regulator
MQRLRVLIADDHPIFRKGLQLVVLADPALELAAEAADGDEALHAIERLKPDLAVLDINMPRLNGLQVARELWLKQSPVGVIMLTVYDDEELFDHAMNVGVRGYVLKENAVNDLVTAIRVVSEGKYFISPSISGLLLNRTQRIERLRQERPGLQELTPTELRILKLVAEDRTSKEIADLLGSSPRTVETHRQNIARKLGLAGTHSLLKFAYDHKSQL